MSEQQGQAPQEPQMLDVQSALFELRDRLMHLKLSLQDLACMHDEHAQRQASHEVEALMSRLRA